MGVTLLIDDLRTFRDGRAHLRARTSEEGLRCLLKLRESSDNELWLDHDLGEVDGVIDSIAPVIDELSRAAFDDEPYDARVFVHTSNPAGAQMMLNALRRWGYDVVRVDASTDLLHEEVAGTAKALLGPEDIQDLFAQPVGIFREDGTRLHVREEDRTAAGVRRRDEPAAEPPSRDD